ncbi:hypothetical protein [Paraburkholderia caffeinilytica]|uniref:hypothetical protein n=1 Tax=Paraburkholderia caffeinilytica TaxID=1761016 RepID=UPI000E218DA6|nr:hypothetical protein [Paraburkholderia caffeinilytica]CAB3804535.1 hypothetical protein LMG28690_06050 [Paraburkholderia caffeinilytica]
MNYALNSTANIRVSAERASGWLPIAIFLVLSSIVPPEITTLLAGVYIYASFLFRKKVYLQGWNRVLAMLCSIALVGVIPGFLEGDIYQVMKDCWYFLKPVEFFILGAYLASGTNHKNLFKAILIAGAVVSLFHVIRLLTSTEASDSSLDSVRDNVGHGYMISTLALSVALFYLRAGRVSITTRFFCLIVSGLTFVSHFSAYSRILWIFSALLLLCFVGVATRLSAKNALIVIAILCLGLGAVFAVSSSKAGSGDATQSLVAKFENSFQEVNIRDYDDVEGINNNWRGYESFVALRQYSQADLLHLLLGQGFGSSVDLGIDITLGGERTSTAPIVHNGFVYVIFKVGAVGLAMYGIFLLWVLKKSYEVERFYRGALGNISGTLAVAIAWIFIVTSFFITGIFNKAILSSTIIVLSCIFSMYARELASRNLINADDEGARQKTNRDPERIVPGSN